MHSVYAPLLWGKDHQHLHLTVQVTILRPTTTTTTTTTTTAQITVHPFSICATALGKIPPPPPPSHSASYNITANHHYHHHHHLDHHNTNYNACIQYMRHCFRKKKQTTSASCCRLGPTPAPFRPPLVPRSTCAQWWKIRTTSASFRGSKLHRHHWRARCSKHL